MSGSRMGYSFQEDRRISIVFLAIVFVMLSQIGCQREKRYNRTIRRLKSMKLQDVQVLKIYPRVTNPIRAAKMFTNQESLTDDFFQSMKDIDAYSPSHDRVASQDHSWFLEIIKKNETIQIQFRIPIEKGQIVAGRIGKYDQNGAIFYGWFQSQLLFQWYQKYSHRWLEPEASQPTPTPQPDPAGGE